MSAGADELALLYSGAAAGGDYFVVVLEDTISTSSVTPSSLGISSDQVNHTYEEVVNGYSASLSAAEARELRAQGGVAYVEEIESTIPGGGTDSYDGTSMAGPHVAGAAALYKAANGDADQATVQDRLVSNAGADKLNGVPRTRPTCC